MLQASSLLARGRFDDFRDAQVRGIEHAEAVGNLWERRRLLVLRLHLAQLHGDPNEAAALKPMIRALEPEIPALFKTSPLYGLG
jgi:hypothetical protein